MHPLTGQTYPNLDPDHLRRLLDAGFDTVESVIDAGPTRLSRASGLDIRACRVLVRGARAVLSGEAEPSVHGLAGAREVERSLSLLRKARAHVGRLPSREAWAEAHARARRQLRKLILALEGLQRSVLAEGATDAGRQHLTDTLGDLDRQLGPLLAVPVRKRTLRELRKVARAARRSLGR
ncbi:MAG: hypothetical protein ABMA64_42780 [Myxococcota bacterium]